MTGFRVVQEGVGHDWAVSQLQELLAAVSCNELRRVRKNGHGSPLLSTACLKAIAKEIRTRDFTSCDTSDLEKLILRVRKPYWQSWDAVPSGVQKQFLLQVSSLFIM